jgi:uncharacterized damage-inducible protein DinB
MLKDGLLKELASAKEFLDRSTRPLTDEHSTFAPKEGLFTVAQQLAHIAQTVEWFYDGAFSEKGFDMDFESMTAEVLKVTKVSDARAWLDRAFAQVTEITAAKSEQEWLTPLPQDSIMGGEPRLAVVSALTDHTAHHRGALTVYQRLLGLVPPMPYMDV